MDKNSIPNHNERTLKDRCFEVIFNKYYYLILNIAEEYLGRDEAMDVCQETFFTVYLRYDLFLLDNEMKALLMRIAMTKSIDRYRRRNREIKYCENWYYERLLERSDNNHSLEWSIATKDFYHRVLEDVKEMKSEWAEVVILHSIFQIPQEEVAIMMDISITALRSRLNRARNYLKAKYGDELKQLH